MSTVELNAGARVSVALIVIGSLPETTRAKIHASVAASLHSRTALQSSPASRWTDEKMLLSCPVEGRFSCWLSAFAEATRPPAALLMISPRSAKDDRPL
ncbi:MAG: hypothetical protein HYV07_16580 [Deltaproteobacteria bacterium]|nr:hypothetical protein [Deltaproteobacteria bacterium]